MADDFDETPADVLNLFEGGPVPAAKPRRRRGAK